jgi:hypothetical protein
MTIFRDPIQTLNVELPAGWAYNPLSSSLTDLFFSRWDKPEDMLIIRIRRSAAESIATDESWVEKIRGEVGEANSLTDIPAGSSRAVATNFVSKAGSIQRVAFVRGRQADLIIEHRGGDLKASNSWTALNHAVQTVASAANGDMSGESDPVEFNRCIEAANQAFEKQDWTSVVEALKGAVQAGTLIWLNSLASPEGKLEINAPIRTAQALGHLGRFTEDPYLLRDAEYILLRARCTMDMIGADQGIRKELEEVLQNIMADLLGPSDPGSSEPLSPVLSIRERAFKLAQAAVQAFDAKDWNSADSLAEVAADDLLSLICFLRRYKSETISEDIAAHLTSEGITDPEDQKTALRNAREAILFPPLNMSLQIRHCCAMERKDAESAADAFSILLPLARLLFDADFMDAGIALNYALTLMIYSGNAALSNEEAEIEDSLRFLYDADRALQVVGGQTIIDDGWIRHYEKQIETIMRALDSRIASGEEITDLQKLRSRFVEISGRFRDAIARLTPAAKETPSE